MSITNFLLLVVIMILIRQFYPGLADALVGILIVGGIAYGGYWLLRKYPAHRTATAQRKADDGEYWKYQTDHEAIRSRYDPNRQWNEATTVPPEYLAEIRALNQAHHQMLRRRNGWTDADFKDDDA